MDTCLKAFASLTSCNLVSHLSFVIIPLKIGSDFRRDVTLGEDRCGVHFPPVAQMLAVLNTVVLSLMDAHQVSNVARQIRRFASHPNVALAWLL